MDILLELIRGCTTESPIASPIATPTESPTASPEVIPTTTPTESSTESPIASPTATPTKSLTESSPASPRATPSDSSTENPTATPTKCPTESPTASPTATPPNSPTASYHYHNHRIGLGKELKEVCASLCALYSQKLVMHAMVSHSNQFSLQSFLPTSLDAPWSSECADNEVSRRLWQVIEYCTSLQSSGWVGEAGAMAMAAEALGLGVPAGDN